MRGKFPTVFVVGCVVLILLEYVVIGAESATTGEGTSTVTSPLEDGISTVDGTQSTNPDDNEASTTENNEANTVPTVSETDKTTVEGGSDTTSDYSTGTGGGSESTIVVGEESTTDEGEGVTSTGMTTTGGEDKTTGGYASTETLSPGGEDGTTTEGGENTSPGGPDHTTPPDIITTSSPSPSTTAPLPSGSEPPAFDDVPWVIPLPFMFNMPWNNSLADKDSVEFINLYNEVFTTLLTIFNAPNAPPSFLRVIVENFRPNTTDDDGSGARKKRDASSDETIPEYTVADFNAEYDVKSILGPNGDAVIEEIYTFVANEALPTLENETIGGYEVFSYYINTVTMDSLNNSLSEIEAVAAEPCSMEGLCPTTCYPECNRNNETYQIYCLAYCKTKNKVCSSQAESAVCLCNEGYLPFLDECANSVTVIAVSASVAGAIVIALLVSTIVLGCRNREINKEKPFTSSSHESLIERAYDPDSIPRDVPGESVNPVFGGHLQGPTFESFRGTPKDMDDGRGKQYRKEDSRDSVLGDSSPEDGRSGSDVGVAPDYDMEYPRGDVYRPSVHRRVYPPGPPQDLLEMESIHIENTDAFRNFSPQLYNVDTSMNYFSQSPLRINLRNSNRHNSQYMYEA